MENILWIIAGVISGSLAIFIWIKGDKISNSPYWAIGYIGFMALIIIITANCFQRVHLSIS